MGWQGSSLIIDNYQTAGKAMLMPTGSWHEHCPAVYPVPERFLLGHANPYPKPSRVLVEPKDRFE
ncbi:MAG: hypothetical protein HQM08_30005 [Candidatus Riflebacteria bacterium]|nr:hypothetical protein [Candidatus Riflebacteria bacterium]